MKRIAPASKRSLLNTNVISNARRESDGPDTPVPQSSRVGSWGLPVGNIVESGNEHFQEVYSKAKKSLKIKSAEEKKRDSMKKKIVMVGISDQSPDGRVSDWL